ncbi:MAG: BrnT family toxin [Pseudomonadota bacterium]
MTGSFEWDEEKSRQCKQERGFGFEIVEYFDFAQAMIVEDDRQDYGERRFRAFGHIEGAAFSIVFTPRGHRLRIISIRRAHEKEMKRYGKSQENP